MTFLKKLRRTNKETTVRFHKCTEPKCNWRFATLSERIRHELKPHCDRCGFGVYGIVFNVLCLGCYIAEAKFPKDRESIQ